MRAVWLLGVLLALAHVPAGAAVVLPDWVRAAAAGAAAPAEAERDADAVALTDQMEVLVRRDGTVVRHGRTVYRILRPGGTGWGHLDVAYSPHERITFLHGWGQGPAGQPYEAADRQAVDAAPSDEVVGTDERIRILTLPGVGVGSLVAFEWTTEDSAPLFDDDNWYFQDRIPERQVQYTLELPAGWQYNVHWRNHAEVPPSQLGAARWQWTLGDVSAVPKEPAMPVYGALAGHMHVVFSGPGARGRSFTSWADLGSWYLDLAHGRDEPTPAISASAAAATNGISDPLARIQAVARWVQTQVRYVDISFGIGGFQPHPVGDVLAKRYGDCKDHSALLTAMLKAIGVRSHYVLVHTERDMVQDQPLPENEFNHVILAIELPADVPTATLGGAQEDPALGRLLYFDSTDSITPSGRLSADLQGTYGLLVLPDGSHLQRLPQQAAALTGVHRTGKWTLDEGGKLAGDVTEILEGDRADQERWALQQLSKDTDREGFLERKLAGGLASYELTGATIAGAKDNSRPLEWRYSFEAESYSQSASDLLLVRPAVLRTRSVSGLMTGKDRHNPVLLLPGRDTDEFEIAIPPGYRVDELPRPVDRDESFASYHSRTSVKDGALHYSRQLEIRAFEVAAKDAQALWSFERTIDSDERSVATLARAPAPDAAATRAPR
jgi:hypothetical protein